MVIADKFILNFFCSPSFPLVFINFTNVAMIVTKGTKKLEDKGDYYPLPSWGPLCLPRGNGKLSEDTSGN